VLLPKCYSTRPASAHSLNPQNFTSMICNFLPRFPLPALKKSFQMNRSVLRSLTASASTSERGVETHLIAVITSRIVSSRNIDWTRVFHTFYITMMRRYTEMSQQDGFILNWTIGMTWEDWEGQALAIIENFVSLVASPDCPSPLKITSPNFANSLRNSLQTGFF